MTPNRTVLIVTSSYAPAMIADMHRARLLAWELPALGWNVEVLAPDSSYQYANCLDKDAKEFFCPDTPVHFTRPYKPILPRALRSGLIGWKALWPLVATGGKLLAQRRFDLVYFSTTQFNLFLLGRWWQSRYRVPYVLDIHDPIHKESKEGLGSERIGFRTAVNRWLLKKIEAASTPSARALISVSNAYLEDLKARHSSEWACWMQPLGHAVIPFGASERDLIEARVRMPSANPGPGELRRVIYVGAGGRVMARAFRVFCLALREVIGRQRDLAARVRFELYGTMFHWREGDRKELSEIAADCGVADFVIEDPRHVSYRRSLELLLGADGALVLGVDDNGYIPSKLYTYALSGRPLLGILRQPSSGYCAFTHGSGLGHLVSFGDESAPAEAGAKALRRFLDEVFAGASVDRKDIIREHLAPAMARRHVELFDACTAKREITSGRIP